MARSHQTIAAVVAGSCEYEDALLADVPALGDDVGNRSSRSLHHRGVAHAGRIGALLQGAHLRDRHDFHALMLQRKTRCTQCNGFLLLAKLSVVATSVAD